MRSMWKGTVAFGLVSIPIQLYAATESKSISFRQVHAADGGRVKYKRVCTIDEEEVPYSDIAKGYELDDGSMVVLTDEDLAQVPVSSSQTIDVLEFLPLEAIDPIAYDRSYYLEPQKAAVKPYVLLRDALAKSGRVALVKVTLRQRESLALLRVYSDVVVLTTLLWPGEVRAPQFDFLDEQPQIRDQELTMAGSLIESMTEEVFDPDAYQDSYQQALRELIDAKIAGQETTPSVATEQPAEVIDLMSALEASITNKKPRGTGTSTASSGKTDKPGKAEKSGDKRTSATNRKRTTRKSDDDTTGTENGSGENGKAASTRSRSPRKAGADKTADDDKSTGTRKSTDNSKSTTRRSKSA